MKDRSEKRYCTLDHANKRRELARQATCRFRLGPVSRRDAGESPPDDREPRHGLARRC